MYAPVKFEDLDQEQCWSFIMGRQIEVGRSHLYSSPLRPDSTPGCNFKWRNGILFLMDSGQNHTCVSAWMKISKLKYWSAIKDLKEKCKGKPRVKAEHVSDPSVELEECEKRIDIKSYWRKDHEDYWNLRGLERPENVYGVIAFSITKECSKKTYLLGDELCFGYKHGDGKFKLYFPNRPKPRFISNLKPDEVWWALRNSDTLVIQKSHKDFLIAKEIFPTYDITHLQSEGIRKIPFEWETYKRIIIWLDSDRAGMECAIKLAQGIISTVKVRIFLVPNQKSKEYISEDILQYLSPNLANYYSNDNNTDNFRDLFNTYVEGKDLDELVTRNKDYKKIIKWIRT